MAGQKIFFAINSMGKGGAERVVSVLSRYFARDGAEVVVATQWHAKEEYTLANSIRRISVGVTKEDEEKGRLYCAVKRLINLRSCIKKEKPDIVISFCNKTNFRCAYSMIGLGIPLLVSVRNDPKRDYAPYRYATKWMEKKAAGCVFQTFQAQAFFSPDFQKKSRIIFNPLSEQYMELASEQEKGNNLQEEKDTGRRIINIGRITAQKNQLLLLRAFARIHEKYPDVKIQIYGEDGERDVKEKMERFLAENGLEKQVRFMGTYDRPEQHFGGDALFVLSSDYEGMSNALMEAMALGLPVISTDCPCGGAAMLIENDISGLLVPVGDEEALAEAMDNLLMDDMRARRLGKNARQIINKVSPEKIYQEWKIYVDELIETGNGNI